MRTVTGNIVLPANAPTVNADQILIEVRDISLADAPSTVIAHERLDDVALKPNGQVRFKIPVPEVESNRRLSLRVHVNLDGSGRTNSGDLLTTASHPIPNTGTPAPLEVPVVVI